MKKFLFISVFTLFFAITSISFAALNRAVLLTKLAQGNLEYLYIDSIKYNGNNVTYETKQTFKNPPDELKKNNIAYILNNITINCATREITYNFVTNYDSNNTIKGVFPYPPNKTPIEPNTITDTKYVLLCKNK